MKLIQMYVQRGINGTKELIDYSDSYYINFTYNGRGCDYDNDMDAKYYQESRIRSLDERDLIKYHEKYCDYCLKRHEVISGIYEYYAFKDNQ